MPTKKPIKKATKKPSAKSKLIDGRYAIKQLIRLEEKPGRILETFMKSANQKTVNGAITVMIEQFETMALNLFETERELAEARQTMRTQTNLLYSLKQNFKQLQELKVIDTAFDEQEEEDEL